MERYKLSYKKGVFLLKEFLGDVAVLRDEKKGFTFEAHVDDLIPYGGKSNSSKKIQKEDIIIDLTDFEEKELQFSVAGQKRKVVVI